MFETEYHDDGIFLGDDPTNEDDFKEALRQLLMRGYTYLEEN